MFNRSRFLQILRSFHIVDNDKLPPKKDLSYRPSARIRPGAQLEGGERGSFPCPILKAEKKYLDFVKHALAMSIFELVVSLESQFVSIYQTSTKLNLAQKFGC